MSNTLIYGLTYRELAEKMQKKGLKQFIYVSDKEKFGEVERWESEEDKFLKNNTFRGDCDTYALTLVRSIALKYGIPKKNLLLFSCTVGKVGHLIGGIYDPRSKETYILDNRLPKVFTLNELIQGIEYQPRFTNQTIKEKYRLESFATLENFTIFYKKKDGYPIDFTEEEGINWSKYPNFSKVEFKCNCGCGKMNIEAELLDRLQLIRSKIKEPIRIVSATRCKKHNKRVGGKKKSAHLSGEAVDIAVPNSRYRFKIKKAIYANKITRIGDYRKQGFIHIDISKTLPNNVEW
jgi:uncharacterized protein YcbK (DUF882 family)